MNNQKMKRMENGNYNFFFEDKEGKLSTLIISIYAQSEFFGFHL